MQFEWDPDKAESNHRNHGVDFADAVLILEDEFAITVPDQDRDEERFITSVVTPRERSSCWL